ncbi:hypothetical protein Misp01_78130 [Microtetraspora sp. NBRC 13810]|nr:hypothetical protein Misp01_78130 [Microtetraspora sp. NBRC 13810]
MIRVLLVDDQPLLRSGFRALLDLEDDIEVVAEAGDGREGLALAREHRPDVALIDIQMPVIDGIEATRRIAADPALAGVHVVILTSRPTRPAATPPSTQPTCGSALIEKSRRNMTTTPSRLSRPCPAK